MSLYNVHRPSTFSDVVGQKHITDILQAKIISEKSSHNNYLMFGPRGTGKTTCARILSKAINCTDLQKDWNPCNKCSSCEAINKGVTLDYIEIDAASHTGVDNIREEILDKVVYPPTHLKKKVYIIDEVHMLSKWAFNALLKTIEEPSDKVCFIFATTEIHKIPETIISRCQVFNFKKVWTDDMVGLLEKVCKDENIKYTKEALILITKIAEGCPRDALKYVDQINILWDISEEHVSKFLGVAPDALIDEFLMTIKNDDRTKAFDAVDKFHKDWIDLNQFAKQVIMHIDEKLSTDPDFYLKVADIFTEIISQIKYYPYPNIVYKIAINKYSNNWTQNLVKKDEKEEVVKLVEQQKSTNSSSPVQWDINIADLTENLINQIDKPSLKAQLSEHMIIEGLEHNVVQIVVINKMTEMLIKKVDTVIYIEKIISDILGTDTKIQITYVKKDDYFANKLG